MHFAQVYSVEGGDSAKRSFWCKWNSGDFADNVGDNTTDVFCSAWLPVPNMSTMNEAEATTAKKRNSLTLRGAVDMVATPCRSCASENK
jgi:hypothetical protein